MTSVAPSSPRHAAPILLPREHGAYGQLLFPLTTALVLARGAAPAVALSVAAIALFAAHESVLVLLGHRGRRALREQRGAALAWLAACGAVAVLAGVGGLLAMPGGRASTLLPIALSLPLAWLIPREQEHSTTGELVAAVALSSCAVPVAVAGRVAFARALACGIVFALAFVVATVAVRSVIARIKPHANEDARASVAPWIAATAIALAVVFAELGWLPWAIAGALLPVCGLAVGLSLFPPHPRHLRAVGWSLITATAATAIVLAIAA